MIRLLLVGFLLVARIVFAEETSFEKYASSMPESYLLDHGDYLMSTPTSLFTFGLFRLNYLLNGIDQTFTVKNGDKEISYRVTTFASYDKKTRNIVVNGWHRLNSTSPDGIVFFEINRLTRADAEILADKAINIIKESLGLIVSAETTFSHSSSKYKLGNMFSNVDDPYPEITGEHIFNNLIIRLYDISFKGGTFMCQSTLNSAEVHCKENGA